METEPEASGVSATDVNVVLSFGSALGGFEIAHALKRGLLARFNWPDDIDSDAMEHKPETVRTAAASCFKN
eukprot:COSAG06_NODE_1328_length_9852_cov_590.986158_1_plen_71_part_00